MKALRLAVELRTSFVRTSFVRWWLAAARTSSKRCLCLPATGRCYGDVLRRNRSTFAITTANQVATRAGGGSRGGSSDKISAVETPLWHRGGALTRFDRNVSTGRCVFTLLHVGVAHVPFPCKTTAPTAILLLCRIAPRHTVALWSALTWLDSSMSSRIFFCYFHHYCRHRRHSHRRR